MKNSLKKLFRVFKLQIGNKQIGCLLDVDNTQVYEVNLPLKPNIRKFQLINLIFYKFLS